MRLSILQGRFLDWLAHGEEAAAALLPLADRAGLGVYQNNYRGSLMACLADSFPKVHDWLGDAAFEAICARHIDRVPPSSWTLDDYALGFPESLIEDYPYDAEVGELALIELALGQAFVAADAQPLSSAGMADVDWDRAYLRTVPALSLLRLATNAAEIWIALDDDLPPPPVRRVEPPATLLIWRRDELCRLRPLEDAEADMLAALVAGVAFADLCAAAVARWNEDSGVVRIGQWLARWVGDGLITVSER